MRFCASNAIDSSLHAGRFDLHASCSLQFREPVILKTAKQQKGLVAYVIFNLSSKQVTNCGVNSSSRLFRFEKEPVLATSTLTQI